MKRNNWFMIAYILFLIIASIVRDCGTYPIWDTLVLAVTVSSAILSYAETFGSTLSANKKLRLQYESLYNDATLWNKRFQERYDLIVSLIEEYGPKTAYYAKIVEDVSEAKDRIKGSASQLEPIDQGKIKARETTLTWMLAIFSVLGFLLFFCVLTFPAVEQMFSEKQSIYTVLSFAVMLSSCYISSFFEEKLNSSFMADRKVFLNWLELDKNFDELQTKIIQGLITEARINAD